MRAEGWSSAPLQPQGNERNGTETSEPLSEPSLTPGSTESAQEPQGDAEAIICGVWGDLCGKALRVAGCESGPDYYAGYSTFAGTFQIHPAHAARFALRGWDYWIHGDDIYANSVVAFELYQESGWAPWCRWT